MPDLESSIVVSGFVASHAGAPLAGSSSIEKRASVVPDTERQRRVAGSGLLIGAGTPAAIGGTLVHFAQ